MPDEKDPANEIDPMLRKVVTLHPNGTRTESVPTEQKPLEIKLPANGWPTDVHVVPAAGVNLQAGPGAVYFIPVTTHTVWNDGSLQPLPSPICAFVIPADRAQDLADRLYAAIKSAKQQAKSIGLPGAGQ